jgi:aminoglycoside phosphotransferase (APT) family kinase protein
MTQAPTPTADTVRRLVDTLLPEEAPGEASGPPAAPHVRLAAEDEDGTLWWVGGRYVLRLASHPEATVRARRELRLRDLVRPHVPLAVPVCVAHGEWAPGRAYLLDTRPAGADAEDRTVSAVGETDLAAFLTGLREVPVRQAETLGVPRRAPRPLDALRASAHDAARRLGEADEFDPARLAPFTAGAAAQLAAQPGAPVLVHHALTGPHLTVGDDGRVRGVLGWGDAVTGDPAEDIAGLARAVGAPAAVRAATLAGYGPRPCLRGLWLARCDALCHLAARLGTPTGDPLPLLRHRLRRAWEPILLERVTDLRGEAGEL